MGARLPPRDARLLARLNQHLPLRGRIDRLIDIVEDARDDLRKAEDAERRMIEAVRRLGQEALGYWANGQVAKRVEALVRSPGIWREGKKNYRSKLSSAMIL